MQLINIEIKARCDHPQRIRDVLNTLGARYAGRDHQVDMYYQAKNGRLKLRRGLIENALIAYDREDTDAPKQSNVQLYPTQNAAALQEVLDTVCVHQVTVDKQRDIFFIDNVKFHVDEVQGLGTFVEIEAMDDTGLVSAEVLGEQVRHYLEILGILPSDLLTHSYSDMLLQDA